MSSVSDRPAAKRPHVPPGVWGMWAIIPALFLFGAGVKAWWAAAKYPAPQVVSYEEFARTMPKAGWYTITGGMIDVRRSVYWEENGVCTDVYAPLQSDRVPMGMGGGAGSDIYVEVDDSPTLSAFQDMTYARRNGGEAGVQNFVAQHMDKFVQRRTFSGLVYYGHRDPMGEWAKAGLNADTVTFLADGWKPNWVYAYGDTAVGGVAAVVCVWLMVTGYVRRRW